MASGTDDVAHRPRSREAYESLRPTRAEVDLGALAHNMEAIRRAADGVRVLAVVKADAYGHGVVPVAGRLAAEGAVGFGVALAEEGIELREAGITAQVLILNGVYGGAHRDVLAARLTPVVYDIDTVAAFQRAARGRRFGFHLKVDTGMSRLGVPVSALDAFLDALEGFPRARIDGVMTHLASADEDPEFTALQLSRFRVALEGIRRRGHEPSLVHAANTAAVLRHPDARFDMVRAGIALYGVMPVPGPPIGLRPVMSLRSEIIALRDLVPGDTVGYGRTFATGRACRLATVPVGYGDGLMRSVSNRGAVLVRGRRCPVVGRVSMDLTAVDVTEVPEVAVADEVVLLGEQGQERIDADEVARAAGTIAYEVLTNVSRRVPRFYRSG